MVAVFILSLIAIIFAIALMVRNFKKVRNLKYVPESGLATEGTVPMYELAAQIRSGARTFMRTEYKVIVPVILVVGTLLSVFIEKAAGLTFLLGALLGSLSCVLGMEAAIYANVRTAAKADAKRSLIWTMKVAMLGGSVSGLSAHGFGLLGVTIVLGITTFGDIPAMSTGFVPVMTCVPLITWLMTLSLGYSLVAMFNRVAGGNFTKAADIAADILAKVKSDVMEEDDDRNPCVLADFVGDNVNDVAGNTSDLSESFVATIVGCTAIARQVLMETPAVADGVTVFGLLLAVIGLVGSTLGIGIFSFKDFRSAPNSGETAQAADCARTDGLSEATQAANPDETTRVAGCWGGTVQTSDVVQKPASSGFKAFFDKISDRLFGPSELSEEAMKDTDPGATLDRVTYIAAAIVVIGGFFGSLALFSGLELPSTFIASWLSPWLSACFGIGSGILIGKITEYYTAAEKKPVTKLANISPEGAAFVVTKGDALGSKSVFGPMTIIVVALIASGAICGPAGIAIAALGMLSFVAATVSIDAFGPIADNAGGIAEACQLDAEVRVITDKLDVTGNTTAAIGKGFAIGSAAFATVSLIYSYLGGYMTGTPILNAAYYVVIGGFVFGSAVAWYFSGMLGDNTIDSAARMEKMAEAQLTEEVMNRQAKPDYDALIREATKNAIRKMLAPSVLALLVPMLGFLAGPDFIAATLMGATFASVALALYMGNSGGAFDNAKKRIEQGLLPGHPKHSEAHKNAVIGDTVGDTRKDVIGVALDIFIKMMSTMANTLVTLFKQFALMR